MIRVALGGLVGVIVGVGVTALTIWFVWSRS